MAVPAKATFSAMQSLADPAKAACAGSGDGKSKWMRLSSKWTAEFLLDPACPEAGSWLQAAMGDWLQSLRMNVKVFSPLFPKLALSYCKSFPLETHVFANLCAGSGSYVGQLGVAVDQSERHVADFRFEPFSTHACT